MRTFPLHINHGWGNNKPPVGTLLDWNDPLTTNLESALALNEGGGSFIHDSTLKNKAHGTLSGTSLTWAVKQRGLALTAPGGSSFIDLGSVGNYTTENFSIAFAIDHNSAGNGVIVYKGQFQSNGYYIQFNIGGAGSIRMTTNQSGANQVTTTSGSALGVGIYSVIVCTRNGATVKFYINGVETGYAAVGTHINPTTSTDNQRVGNYAGGTNPFIGNLYWYAQWRNRVLNLGEIEILTDQAFRFYRPARRRIWNGSFPVVGNPVGGGLDTLHALTESSTGKIGTRAGATDTLQHLTAQASGQVVTSALTGGGKDALHALTDLGGGKIGAKAGATQTLQALNALSSGGQIGPQATIQLGGTEVLQPISVLLAGQAGALAGVAHTLHALLIRGGGTVQLPLGAVLGGGGAVFRHLFDMSVAQASQIGAVGNAADVLNPIQSTGGGFIPVTEVKVTGGAPAWWGYEGQAGYKGRPWWYSDLKDKARDLERLRKIRVELGILPAPQNKKIKRLVKQTNEFADEHPTPKTADIYMKRSDEIRERVDAAIRTLDEEDDERTIMEMSKFFFLHNKPENAAWSH